MQLTPAQAKALASERMLRALADAERFVVANKEWADRIRANWGWPGYVAAGIAARRGLEGE